MAAMQPSHKRRKAEQKGRLAEEFAGLYLRLIGYRILKKRYRSRNGEIDLIARKGRLVVFVEVKLRSDRREATLALTSPMFRRIDSAARSFMAGYDPTSALDWRYDAVTLFRWGGCHLRDVWRPESTFP